MDIYTEAVAKERILRDAQIAEAKSLGSLRALEGRLADLSQAAAEAASTYFAKKKAREDAEAITGSVVTDGFGPYSSIDTLLRKERFAGKGASIDFIKANPECLEEEAEAAWTTAALAATGLPALVVQVRSYSALYRENLVKAGLIDEPTYEAQRAWIIATPKEVIMGA